MSPRRFLIVYGTTHGQTARIAQRIAEVLTAGGDSVTLADAAALPRDLATREFDAILVGSSVTYGRHQRSVRRFVRAWRDRLALTPSAFFSVSGGADEKNAEGPARARRYVDDFLRDTAWRPQLVESIAGAMTPSKYGPVLRWLLAREARRRGDPVDTTRDQEFTDWAQVRRFAEAFAATVPHPAGAHALLTA